MTSGSPLQASLIASSLSITERAIRQRAVKENWPYTEEPVRGGRRRLYPLASLPADVQAAVARHQALQAANALQTSAAYQEGQRIAKKIDVKERIEAKLHDRIIETGAKAAVGLSGAKKSRMDARLDILARLDEFASSRRVGIVKSMEEFCALYNSGEIQVPVSARHMVGPTLTRMTLYRWRKTLKQQGAAALAGEYGNRSGTSTIDTHPEIRDRLIGFLVDKPHASVKVLYALLGVHYAGQLPSPRSTARWLSAWKRDNAEAFMRVSNPDKWKGRYKPAFGKLDENIERINQLWQVDSTPADLQLIDGRYNILASIDLATRRARMHVAKTSNAEAVCKLLRKSIIDWGVPEQIKMDNGADYASNRVQYALKALHIEPKFSMKFAPWEKGNIERLFKSFSHGFFEILPGFSGHNVAEAQVLRDAKSFYEQLFTKDNIVELKLTAEALQQFCNEWVDNFYAHEPHQGLGGKTPFERSAELRHPIRTIDDPRALDLLLAEVPSQNGLRTVGKKGLRIDGQLYIAPELFAVINQPVKCFYNDDSGSIVVYHNDAFLCIAECPEIMGFTRVEIAVEATRLKNAQMKESNRYLKSLKRKANLNETFESLREKKRLEAEALVALPKPNVIHITPALEAAGQAADALEATPPRAVPECTVEHLDDVRDLRIREFAEDETSNDRFKRAMDYLLVPETERNDIQRRFLRSHCTSAEFMGRWDIFEGFGPSAVGLDDSYLVLMPDGAFYHRYIQLKNSGEN